MSSAVYGCHFLLIFVAAADSVIFCYRLTIVMHDRMFTAIFFSDLQLLLTLIMEHEALQIHIYIYCATSRKITGSIPDGVTVIFH